MIKLILLFIPLITFADRIAGSQYTHAKIVSKIECQYKDKLLKPSKILIQFPNKKIFSSILSSHTKIIKNGKSVKCEDIKPNKPIKLGYAFGNDISGQEDYLIVDSIEIKNKP